MCAGIAARHPGRGAQQPQGGDPPATGWRILPFWHVPRTPLLDLGDPKSRQRPTGDHAPLAEATSGNVRTECHHAGAHHGGEPKPLGGEQLGGRALDLGEREHHHGCARERLGDPAGQGAMCGYGAYRRSGLGGAPLRLLRHFCRGGTAEGAVSRRSHDGGGGPAAALPAGPGGVGESEGDL